MVANLSKLTNFYYYYHYYCIEEAHGEAVRFSVQDTILCQNGRMSHEKQCNDLHIYVKSGVIVYPQPRIHNSVSWAWSRVGP